MRRCLAIALIVSMLPSAARAAEIVVRMAGADYTPAVVEAEVGDRILFINDDVVDHDVFVPTAGYGADLGKQAPGAETTLQLGKSGHFEVECVFHPQMHLEVQVSE